MAFREFTDSAGTVWRAWDVSSAQLHPVTRGEDFLKDMMDGWLAFESATERRRMPAPYPCDWTELPIPELEALCRQAPAVSGRKPRTASGEFRAFIVAEADKAAIATGARTFATPRGREWTVRLHECLDKAGQRESVLRFTTGDIVVDLKDWPDDWQRASVEQYAMMLLDAEPPRRLDGGRGPRRRREDRPPADVAQADAPGVGESGR